MKIINKEEIKNWINDVPLVPQNEIKIIYDNDYWDGPLEGVLEWQNKKYYFISYNNSETKDGGVRSYAIIEMNEEQEKEENYFHQLFIKYVGSHNEYDSMGKIKNNQTVKSITEQEKFYSEYKKAKEYKIEQHQIKAKW